MDLTESLVIFPGPLVFKRFPRALGIQSFDQLALKSVVIQLIFIIVAVHEVEMTFDLAPRGVYEGNLVHAALIGAVCHQVLALSHFTGQELPPEVPRQVVGLIRPVAAE
jgi:hypothetical protein